MHKSVDFPLKSLECCEVHLAGNIYTAYVHVFSMLYTWRLVQTSAICTILTMQYSHEELVIPSLTFALFSLLVHMLREFNNYCPCENSVHSPSLLFQDLPEVSTNLSPHVPQ